MRRTLVAILVTFTVVAAPRAMTLPPVESVRCLAPQGGLMPTFFPDGEQIAYVRPTGEGEQQLWLFTMETRKTVRLGGIDDAGWPTVSPVGRCIAYLSGPVFARRIHVVDAANGETRAVTREPGFMSRPCWIDNGKRIASCTGRKTNE